MKSNNINLEGKQQQEQNVGKQQMPKEQLADAQDKKFAQTDNKEAGRGFIAKDASQDRIAGAGAQNYKMEQTIEERERLAAQYQPQSTQGLVKSQAWNSGVKADPCLEKLEDDVLDATLNQAGAKDSMGAKTKQFDAKLNQGKAQDLQSFPKQACAQNQACTDKQSGAQQQECAQKQAGLNRD